MSASEPCPLNLAPTSSTTAMLDGDAMAVALLQWRGFTEQDFARAHPGGTLRQAPVHVEDVMRRGAAVCKYGRTRRWRKDCWRYSGMTAIVDVGRAASSACFTDGDLRRTLDRLQTCMPRRCARS